MNSVTPDPRLPLNIDNSFRLKLADYLGEFARSINQAANLVLWKTVAVSTAYTAGVNDHIIRCTSGPYTVTIPSASSMNGKRIVIKRADSGTSTLTISSASGNIDGAGSTSLTTAWQSRELFSDGTQWLLV
jgi:hypothetical protein